ncbi:S26 family signal peptidase [Hyphomicrobium sp.]|uniref:S26 family signal peptidase n=1 Tax=Hyphomicrobium sp. TaxID=82 RepID=UPI002FE06C50
MRARHRTLVAMLAGATLVVFPLWHQPRVRLIWNASASVPVGLYRVLAPRDPKAGALVVVTPTDELARFLAERGYLPRGLPLIKRLMARAGATVCRVGALITVDGAMRGVAHAHDSRGRPLPRWQGCRTLDDDEVFVMNRDAPDSFDGRYIGPLPVLAITGRAVPIWTAPAPSLAVDATRAAVDREP